MDNRSDNRLRLPQPLYAEIQQRAAAEHKSVADLVTEMLDAVAARETFAAQLRALLAAEMAPLREDIARVEQRSAELVEHFDAMLKNINAPAKRSKTTPAVDWRKVVEAGNKQFGIETR